VQWPGTQFIDKELPTVLGRLESSSQMQSAEQQKDSYSEVSCDASYSFQKNLNIRSTFKECLLADDTLSSCGVLDLDQLCGNVSHNSDELEMGGQVAYDCQYVPTCSEVMEYLKNCDHFLHSNTHVPEKVEKILGIQRCIL
jgi:hypothetical protein